MPGKRRTKALEEKRNRKRAQMKKPGIKSTYAKKAAYLRAHGGSGVQYEDKPWKS